MATSLPTPGTSDVWGTQLNTAIESLHLGPDTHANRPTTGLVKGTLYSCTDHNLIYRWSGSAWATYATLGSTSAASTTFTPAGNIAATDVQAALAEVDSEKETPSGATAKANSAVSTHAAATDPHGDRAYADTIQSGGFLNTGYTGTEESTTSTSYGDLATVGPSVTFTARAGRSYMFVALVDAKVAAGTEARCSVALTGANTKSAGDGAGISVPSTSWTRTPLVVSFEATASGSTTATLKYRTSSGGIASTFRARALDVWEV